MCREDRLLAVWGCGIILPIILFFALGALERVMDSRFDLSRWTIGGPFLAGWLIIAAAVVMSKVRWPLKPLAVLASAFLIVAVVMCGGFALFPLVGRE